MNWSKRLRQINRWLSIIFSVIIVAIFALLGTGNEPAYWVYFLPLSPLAPLIFSGLYMFFLPYAAQRRTGRVNGTERAA